MEVVKTALPGLVLLTPRQFTDDRGIFWETYHEKKFAEHGLPAAAEFVQDNQSVSKRGVLRGLHFQQEPYAQGKLVRCITGRVLDVVVDIRPASPTFGQHEKFLLTAESGQLLWVPKGFAHGFVALEDDTVFVYKCTDFYHKAAEGGLLWNDPALGIDWELDRYGITSPIVSEKDLELSSWKAFSQSLKADA